jgi:hypothetical protein
MDNLAVHKSYVVRDELARLNIEVIFNCAYYPDGNPIELIFSMTKNAFKRMKTNDILNGRTRDTVDLVKKSFVNITRE